MGDKSKIEWTDATWNPVTGCTPVSAGCDHCYAKRTAKRLRAMGQPNYDNGFKVTCHPHMLEKAIRWKRPRKIFPCSMSDLFHEDVPDQFIAAVFGVMAACPQHIFQVLTKRPGRMLKWFECVGKREREGREFFPYDDAEWRIRQLLTSSAMASGCSNIPPHHGGPWPLPNVWLGVTAENQDAADERVPILLRIPAAKRFVSIEPMLDVINLTRIKWHRINMIPKNYTDLGVPPPDEIWSMNDVLESRDGDGLNPPKVGLDWVIVGGESGPSARAMHPQWVRSIRDQCKSHGVPFLFKQWGEWATSAAFKDESPPDVRVRPTWLREDGLVSEVPVSNPSEPDVTEQHGWIRVARVGKKFAGRKLDGEIWDEYPG